MNPTMKFELKSQFQIESARFLPNLPASHPCSRMHGHSFVLILSFHGKLNPETGWVRDYHEINEGLKPLLSQLDHHILNEVSGLENPTSELLAVWLYERARKIIPELVRVTIKETPNTECSYPI
jgi:6-pyruvoyltetrahydropterin/6-carboxytetrahydropterin synthase